jgi:hypothetical protein
VYFYFDPLLVSTRITHGHASTFDAKYSHFVRFFCNLRCRLLEARRCARSRSIGVRKLNCVGILGRWRLDFVEQRADAG